MTEQTDPHGPVHGCQACAEQAVNDFLHRLVDHHMTNHLPQDESILLRMQNLRNFAKSFGHAIVDLCPDSRDRDLALTHLEDALSRAVASVARNQDEILNPQIVTQMPPPPTEGPQEGVEGRREQEISSEVEQALSTPLEAQEHVFDDDGVTPPFESPEDLEYAAEEALTESEKSRGSGIARQREEATR